MHALCRVDQQKLVKLPGKIAKVFSVETKRIVNAMFHCMFHIKTSELNIYMLPVVKLIYWLEF